MLKLRGKAQMTVPDCSHAFPDQKAVLTQKLMDFQQHTVIELGTAGTIGAWEPGLTNSKLIFALHHTPAI